MKRYALFGSILLLLVIVTAGVILPVLNAEDPCLTPVPVDIRELKQSPEKFVGLTIRFDGMFHGLENLWAPFFTPFVREDYLVFSVWPSNAEVWTREGRLDDLPTCFLRKNDRLIRTLLGLKPYVPVEVCGVVLSDFHKLPWIEVTSINVLGDPRYTREEIRERIRLAPEPKEKPGTPAPDGQPPAGVAAPAPEPAAVQALQARVAELERALASRQTENADLRRQVESLRDENARLNVRFTSADRARRDADMACAESERTVASLKSKNEALAKRVENLESMLRTIFGSIDAATEKLKEVEKKQEKSTDTAAPKAPSQAKAN